MSGRDVYDCWNGLTPQGKQVSIDHGKLMDWARDRDKSITVGWGEALTIGIELPSMSTMPDGTRLARSLRACIKRGWHDLAVAFVNKDGDQFCALIGEDLQNGISGFGDTPDAAVAELADKLAKAGA